MEIKLARTKEDIDDIDRQFKAAKEDRENTAIQLNKMQEEFRLMTEDRDHSLQQWEATVLQSDNCRKQLDKARIVRFIISEYIKSITDVFRPAGLPNCKRACQRRSKSTRQYQ